VDGINTIPEILMWLEGKMRTFFDEHATFLEKKPKFERSKTDLGV